MSLLVARIAANNEHDAATANHFAFVADAFDAGTYFHRNTRSGGSVRDGAARPERNLRSAVNA